MRVNQLKTRHLVMAAALGFGALLMMPQISSAMVQGACVVCHTMHNSQNNSAMNFNVSATPNDVLLRGNCIECHTGTNTGTNVRPYVLDLSAVSYGSNTLAGGNFYWVDNGTDSMGHNVDMLPGGNVDGDLSTPPGFDEAAGAWATRVAAQTDMAAGGNLTCAGTAGCHGDRTQTTNAKAVSGAHHANDNTIDGNTVGTSFRFLSGVLGTEINAPLAQAWEYANNNAAHNEYYGIDRATQGVDNTGTISSLCAQCHGGFHNNIGVANFATAGIQGSGAVMTSPWVRHPTDFDMANAASGSNDYAGAMTGAYTTTVPVGTATLQGATNVATIKQTANDAIVLCISCHRAHGSPYDDLLRWNYSLMTVGNSGTGSATGCFVCHTTKDGV